MKIVFYSFTGGTAMDQEKIGAFISTLRKEHGMTQQQLADAIGVSNKTISKWECGVSPTKGY